MPPKRVGVGVGVGVGGPLINLTLSAAGLPANVGAGKARFACDADHAQSTPEDCLL